MNSQARLSVRLQLDRPAARISQNLFGLHVEHIWNCVYPAIWVGDDSNVPNIAGIRRDVVDSLAALQPSVCKYPGGYFSDFYDWRDGVGPREQRPVRCCPTQPQRIEANQFGTAEFVTFCRLIGAEPYLSVNTTSIEANTAAHWVEYCNRADRTYWAEQRRRHGYDEPFNVRYWAIGNEPYWLHSSEEYAGRYRRWVHWMYNTDPTISIVAGGVEPGQCVSGPWNSDGRWGDRFLDLTGAASDIMHASWHSDPSDREILYSFHPYFSGTPACSESDYRSAFENLNRRLRSSIRRTCELLDETRKNARRPKLCFDEYGLLFPGWRMDGNMTQPAPFWSALWLAAFFHLCFEHADSVEMATLPGTINMEHELLVLEGERVTTTPSYHLFGMMRSHGGSDLLECHIEGEAPSDPLMRPPIAVVASRVPGTPRVTLSALNLDLVRPLRLAVRTDATELRVESSRLLYHSDIHTENSGDEPDRVSPRKIPVEASGGTIVLTIPAHSVAVVGLHVG